MTSPARTSPARTAVRTIRSKWRHLAATPQDPATRKFWAERRAQQPSFKEAVLADTRIAAANRGERFEFTSTADVWLQALRLAWVTDAFLGQCFYRAKVHLLARRVPILPRILHRLAMRAGGVCIGDPVVMEPGVFIAHGMVCIDGITEIAAGVIIGPYSGLGLVSGNMKGPTIGPRVLLGAGSFVLGPVVVGEGAKIGAGAMVFEDVPAGASALGVPGRVRGSRTS